MPKKIILKLKLSDVDIKKFENINNIDYSQVYYPDATELHEIKPLEQEELRNTNFKIQENNIQFDSKNIVKTIKEFSNEFYVTTSLYSSEYVNIDEITNISKNIPYKYTDSVCWWCCHYLDENCIPVPIPVKYNEILKKFKCVGIFCSFNCALAYCKKMSYGDASLLYYLYKKTNLAEKKSQNIIPFKQAPDREVLKMFGGILTISEFRESCKNNINSFNILEYPIVYNQRTIVHSKNLRYSPNQDEIKIELQEESIKEPEKFPDFFGIEDSKKIKKKIKKPKSKSISEMLKIQS